MYLHGNIAGTSVSTNPGVFAVMFICLTCVTYLMPTPTRLLCKGVPGEHRLAPHAPSLGQRLSCDPLLPATQHHRTQGQQEGTKHLLGK